MTKLLPCNEWANKLALKPADLAPDEHAALEAHLATCPGCSATYADYQALMARLRALPRPALPPLAPLELGILDASGGRDQTERLDESKDHEWQAQPGSENTPPMRLAPRRHGTWLRWLSAAAAVLLLTALVGSLVGVLVHRSQGTGGPGESFHLRPGWTTLAEYSGVGSQTISGQHIALPYLWGSTFTCVGDGKVDVRASGPAYIGDFGADHCSDTSAINVSPNSISIQREGAPQINSIKVSANAGTSWYLLFAQAVPQPTLKLGTEWVTGMGIGGVGKNSSLSGQGPVTFNGQPLQSKLWGVLFVCIGTGTGIIQIGTGPETLPQSSTKELAMSPCDGQLRFVSAQYAFAVSIGEIDVQINGDLLWTATLVGCSDAQKCGE